MVDMYYTEHGLPIEEDKEWWKYEERYTMGMEDDERYKNVVAMDEKVLKLHLKSTELICLEKRQSYMKRLK